MQFAVRINATKEKVWNTLWNDNSYRKWTAIFAEGSYAVTDNWKEGSKVLFLDGKRNGMVSMVAGNRPYEYMSFVHKGEVKDGIEETESEQVKQWEGMTENYTLTPSVDGTELLVEMEANMSVDIKDYFEKTWPLAMKKIKELAEEK